MVVECLQYFLPVARELAGVEIKDFMRDAHDFSRRRGFVD